MASSESDVIQEIQSPKSPRSSAPVLFKLKSALFSAQKQQMQKEIAALKAQVAAQVPAAAVAPQPTPEQLYHQALHAHDTDRAYAFEHFRRAAELEYPPAYYWVGSYLYQDKNYKEAAFWLEKSAIAEPRNGAAHFMLCLMYETGDGVERNLDTSRQWLRLAESFNYQPAIAYHEKLKKRPMSP
jgi:TPR repeat protein